MTWSRELKGIPSSREVTFSALVPPGSKEDFPAAAGLTDSVPITIRALEFKFSECLTRPLRNRKEVLRSQDPLPLAFPDSTLSALPFTTHTVLPTTRAGRLSPL